MNTLEMSTRSLKPAGRIGIVTGVLVLVVLGLLIGYVIWPRRTDSLLRYLGVRVKKLEDGVERRIIGKHKKKAQEARKAGAADPAKKKRAMLGEDGAGRPPPAQAPQPPKNAEVTGRRSEASGWNRGQVYPPARVTQKDVVQGTQQAITGQGGSRITDFSKNLVKSYNSDTVSTQEKEILALIKAGKTEEARAMLRTIGEQRKMQIQSTAYGPSNLSQKPMSMRDHKAAQVDVDSHLLGVFADERKKPSSGMDRLYGALGERNATTLQRNAQNAQNANTAAMFNSDAAREENRLIGLAVAGMGSEIRSAVGSLGVRPSASAELQKGSVDKLMLAVNGNRGATTLMRTDQKSRLTTGGLNDNMFRWQMTPPASKIAETVSKEHVLRCGNVTGAQFGAAMGQKTATHER